ncbi:MAG: hypothetical protein H7301_06815 [Cryobacterium sp.]|nr:hypothetical protein [Oligoflexia bacterium]
MTLFQAIIASIVGVFSEIYPIAPGAHQSLLEYFFGWNVSHPRLQGAVEFGVFLSLIFTLRHDILSHISSFIQVVVYRKKPRAMDEKMPIFILIGVVAPIAAFFLFRQSPILPSENALLFAAVFGLSGLPMAFFDYYAKKTKAIYDWNLPDAVLVGIGCVSLVIPELGRTLGAFTVAGARGYKREGAAKVILYFATPILGVSAWYHLKGPGAALSVSEFPPLYYWVSLAVAFLSATFFIHVFLSSIQKTPLLRYAVYRILVAATVIGVHFYRAGL